MTTSMVYPGTNLDCIHPDKLLLLVIPNCSEFLLAYRTWLVCEGGVRGREYMFSLWVGSRLLGRDSGFSCSGGSICERNIFGVVARLDPFLGQVLGNVETY